MKVHRASVSYDEKYRVIFGTQTKRAIDRPGNGVLVSHFCVCGMTFNNRRRSRSRVQVETAHEFHIGVGEPETHHLDRGNQSAAEAWGQAWQMGRTRPPSGINGLHSGSSGATPANRMGKNCCLIQVRRLH